MTYHEYLYYKYCLLSFIPTCVLNVVPSANDLAEFIEVINVLVSEIPDQLCVVLQEYRGEGEIELLIYDQNNNKIDEFIWDVEYGITRKYNISEKTTKYVNIFKDGVHNSF